MTYSVIALDHETGAFAVGVQSRWFNTGASVPWVRSGVGAVATQAAVDPGYGPRGLALMGEGMSAPDALERLLADDPARERRQVAFVDTSARVAVHTGAACIAVADHQTGDGWAVLGNLLAGADVIPSMAAAFVAARGDLQDRILSTLDAAQAAGGDLRGMQSAALRLAPPVGRDLEEGVELLVADHPEPLGELRRLVGIDRTYRALHRANAAGAGGDTASALSHYEEADPSVGTGEVGFWTAVGLHRIGRSEEATALLDRLFDEQPVLAEVLRRLSVHEPSLGALAQPQG